jgi:hypothetical protein
MKLGKYTDKQNVVIPCFASYKYTLVKLHSPAVYCISLITRKHHILLAVSERERESEEMVKKEMHYLTTMNLS